MTIADIHQKIFNQFHRTRLTNDLHLTLTADEVVLLLATLDYKAYSKKGTGI